MSRPFLLTRALAPCITGSLLGGREESRQDLGRGLGSTREMSGEAAEAYLCCPRCSSIWWPRADRRRPYGL